MANLGMLLGHASELCGLDSLANPITPSFLFSVWLYPLLSSFTYCLTQGHTLGQKKMSSFPLYKLKSGEKIRHKTLLVVQVI